MDLAASKSAPSPRPGQANQERHWRRALGGLLALSISTQILAAAEESGPHAAALAQDVTEAARLMADEQAFAQLAKQMPNIRAQVAQLLEQTRRSSTPIVDELQHLASDPQRPPLQRDALIHSYAMALRQLRPSQVDSGSLHWLEQYTPQSWVRHDESASYLMPAFDVAAALAGTRNEWDYQAGIAAANNVEDGETTRYLHQYQQASVAFQRGFDQQIQHLDDAQLQSWHRAMEQIPAMTHSALAGEILLRHASVPEIATWLQQASPAQELKLLRRAQQRFDEGSGTAFFYQLCQQLLSQGSAVGQCLGLAPLPTSPDDPMNQSWHELLVPLLSHAELGASAAQILARQLAAGHISPAQFERWRETLRDERTQQRLALMAHLYESHKQLELATEEAL